MLVLNTVDMLSRGVKNSVPLHLWKVSCCHCFIETYQSTNESQKNCSQNDSDYGFSSIRVGITVFTFTFFTIDLWQLKHRIIFKPDLCYICPRQI